MSPRPRRSSAASHHVEWLQLVDISGPFLSLSVLTETFPQGLDGVDPEIAERLRNAYSEWTANQELRHPDIALHTAFLRLVLREILEYPSEFIADTQELGDQFIAPLPEHGVTLRPDLAIRRPGELPKLLLSTYPAEVPLQKPYDDRGFHASPTERMRLLLRQTGVRSGLVTNGGEWLLVHVPADRTATFVTWYTNLLVEERITLRAVRSLLGTRRLFGVDDPETLDGLFERSRDDEREVTDQLGLQTRRAVELLISAFDRADRDTGGKLLEHIPEYRLYEAALAVVMRIIFLLAAEARGLFPDDGPWADSYAITPLRAQLEELADKGTLEALDRRFDAWPRLLATFRAVHDGVEHSRVRMPGYGGGLFDPARYPFLEGADRIVPRVSNRAVLHILDALQTLEVDVPGGRERRPLSFRALGVEQIGHVYEGLLDHTAIRADAPALGFAGTAKQEPEIPLAELEGKRTRGEEELIEFLVAQTGRSRSALKKGLGAVADPLRVAHLREVCDHDDGLVDRVLPFLGLVRDDVFGLPMVFRTGAIYVTESPGRRATGTHYTPPSLTEPIVQYALEPVVYRGPTEGKAREEWELRRPSELLELKVADIAMGSAAFLVAACRYLATRLVESWERFPDEIPADAGADLEERELNAGRLVAERCLYGVDVNPLAVEIAKVSLWLTTLRRDRPFTFLDHALRCGDSLLGLISLDQLEALTLKPENGESILLEPARETIRTTLDEVRRVRERIEATDAVDLRETEEKATALAGVERSLRALTVVGDFVVGASLEEVAGKGKARTIVEAAAEEIREAFAETVPDRRDALLARVEARAGDALMAGRAPGAPDPPRPFHWVLEFPEVLQRENGGFDVIVGNPPFLGNRLWAGQLGGWFQAWASELLGGPAGKIDLCVLFFARGVRLVRPGGCLGLIGTTSLVEGASLKQFQRVLKGTTLFRAQRKTSWPGLDAQLTICKTWIQNSTGGQIPPVLDELPVPLITPELQPGSGLGDGIRRPETLANGLYAFEGSHYAKAHAFFLLADSPWLNPLSSVSSPFLRRVVGAEDLAQQGLRKERWIVDTLDTSLEEVGRISPETLEFLMSVVRPQRTDEILRPYEGLAERWWQLWRPRAEDYGVARERSVAVVLPIVTKYVFGWRLPSKWTFLNSLIVVADEPGFLGLVNSFLFDVWVGRFSGRRDDRMNVGLSSAVRTFPRPIGHAGERVLRVEAEWQDALANCLAEMDGGMTSVLNGVHAGTRSSLEHAFGSFRSAIRDLDAAIAAWYRLDLELDHDFRETPLGLRYTISEAVKTETLDRLLELNHERYAEEVRAGLHSGPKTRGKRGKRAVKGQMEL